ncbi:MAG: ATP synthase F1 subunit epsilon [Micavibrio aeruginosavorus]|uniref:ATP synthase epsilon chain n=1 Tax=Micavibrio aeruginosavorus TaxID=349221 RepID=A0A2W5HNN6_9BACT|nr:MAG: ATP synthase F1 subunit epsilon [Micavibrio aeruginosavorus]
MVTQFNFELVSPEEKLISESAFQVTIPGQEGDVGVRAGHMSLVISMRPGVVTIQREENSVAEKIFIAGGFADIGQDHVTVLAEEAIPVANLSREKLEAELRDLEDDIKMADNDADIARIQNKKALVGVMLLSLAA